MTEWRLPEEIKKRFAISKMRDFRRECLVSKSEFRQLDISRIVFNEDDFFYLGHIVSLVRAFELCADL